MAANTEEFLTVLKEKDKTDYIKSLIPAGGGGSTYDPTTVMQEKGVITDMADVVETGIYHGTDVANSPATGPVLVMASQDAAGNFGFFVMDQNMDLHMGGQPVGGQYHWSTMMTDVTTETMIREFRKTVQQDIADHAKPTRAECITTFKKLPHFDFSKDDDYYIQDTSGSKLVLIKYRAGNATDEASAGAFHYEVLTTAV